MGKSYSLAWPSNQRGTLASYSGGILPPLSRDLMRSLWVFLLLPHPPAAAKSVTSVAPEAFPALASLAASTAEIVLERNKSLTAALKVLALLPLTDKAVELLELLPSAEGGGLDALPRLLLLDLGFCSGSTSFLASPRLCLMPPLGAMAPMRREG